LRVWLVTVGEPVPLDDGRRDRLHRVGMLAEALVARGHEVLWWTSSFDHFRRKQRFSADTTMSISEGYRVRFLRSVGYQRTISVRRLIDHWELARKFATQAVQEPVPDVIHCSLPTIELSVAATAYGKKHGVPVVIDARDQWPDIFLEVLPLWGRNLGRAVLAPMFSAVRQACRDATALWGITPGYVDWALAYAGRARTAKDQDFPLGYDGRPPSAEEQAQAIHFWADLGLRSENDDFIACFFGAMSEQSMEMRTVFAAAKQLQGDLPVKFVLCGSGGDLQNYKALAAGTANVVFPGWIGAAEIWALMRMSSVGLAPYRSSPSFVCSIPNKAIEYMSAGLPVISSLKGTLKDLLAENQCGITYPNGNPDALAHTLRELMQQPRRRQALGENALRLFHERFDAQKVYLGMCDALEELKVSG
jgi:glycosyltransferase involved in cell wall biosynthesis